MGRKKKNNKKDYNGNFLFFIGFILLGALAFSLDPEEFFTTLFGFIILFVILVSLAIFLIGYLESQNRD